jgi:hypothetical protein
MYCNNQIVGDIINKRPVMFMGFYEIDEKFAAVFMTEEKFKSTGTDITLEDCELNLKTQPFEANRKLFTGRNFDDTKNIIVEHLKNNVIVTCENDVISIVNGELIFSSNKV